jgi:hypothetical protein
MEPGLKPSLQAMLSIFFTDRRPVPLKGGEG